MAKILILGGNRFFGKRLAKSLVTEGHDVSIANRGRLDDGLQNQVKRIQVDRDSLASMKEAFRGMSFDFIFDQIAYTSDHAESAIEVFSGLVGRYTVASTMSVYQDDLEGELNESHFNPQTFDLAANPHLLGGSHHGFDYTRAKQRMEATFFQRAKFPVVAARLSFVMGRDDYTRRLNFHVDHVREQKPIYFPNRNVLTSMIDSQDAAEGLIHLGFSSETGSFNLCARKPIALNRLMRIIEEKVQKKTIYTDHPDEGDFSPYGTEKDRYLDVSKLEETGFGAKSIESWISDIID